MTGSPARGSGSAAREAEAPAASALPTLFFARPARTVARELLGAVLVSQCGEGRVAGRVVETEAYTGPDDPACHAAASIGRTRRNDPLYGPPGTAYIHLNYGIHWCLNVVTDREEYPAGVLIRALEPLEGEALMRQRRGHIELTSGPGRLTQALAIAPELQRHRLDRPPLWLQAGTPVADGDVGIGPRIGISRAAGRPLRFWDLRSRWVSQ